jgi:hypothetical protein
MRRADSGHVAHLQVQMRKLEGLPAEERATGLLHLSAQFAA